MSAPRSLKYVVISDFNVETLNRLMANDALPPRVVPIEAPYGQVNQLIARADAPVWREGPDFVVAWTQPQSQLPSFSRLLQGEEVNGDDLLADVDDHVDRLSALGGRVRFVFVPTWVLEPTRAFSMLGLRPGLGIQHALISANLRLLERIAERTGLYPLDAGAWFAGAPSFSAKLWHLAKNPYAQGVHKAAAGAIKSALRSLLGGSRKLIVLDLDETLWGGVVGEVGWQNVRLGGHDPVGEAFVSFQRTLKSLTHRGILLALASRNDEPVALEAIEQNPEMQLRLDDFAGWRINWGDKAKSVAELTESLNLGLDSVVFIDDDPVQRARVHDALPQVLVPDWPADPMQYSSALLDLDCFDSVGLSAEDRKRTEMYVADRKRSEHRAEGSFEEWLATLEIVATCERLVESNLTRAAQLLNKTNQMNMTTRRLSEAELKAWSELPGNHVWAFRVADRYGDLGLTGLLGLQVKGSEAAIVDFLLSCRAMGRKIEETMLGVAVAVARASDAAAVTARFIPTARNRPCLEFLEGSGWKRSEDLVFRWQTLDDYPFPGQVRLQGFEVPAAYR